MATSPSEVREHLSEVWTPLDEIPEQVDENHYLDQLDEQCVALLDLLGYDDEYVHEDASVSLEEIPDLEAESLEGAIVVAEERTDRPHVIARSSLGSQREIEIKPDGIKMRSELSTLRKCFSLDCQYFLVFSNEYIILAEKRGYFYNYPLDRLDQEYAEELVELLEAPERLR